MNTPVEIIQSLVQLNRKALRELAEVAETTSADFVHICKAQDVLNEQFHILLQQKEELERAEADMAEPHESATPTLSAVPETEKEKRGRGAEKQHYLRDHGQRASFVAHLQRIFLAHYIPGKKFRLLDGSEVKAPSFLACLYDLGIKLGITSPEVPVRDFCDMVAEAATECAKSCDSVQDFNTAYNTVQKEIKRWNAYAGDSHLYYTNVRFHLIDPATVPAGHSDRYTAWRTIYCQVEQIYSATKEA